MTTLLNNEVLPSVDESDNAMSAISESQSTNILANSKEPPDKLKEIDIHVDAPDNFKAIDPHGGSKRRVSFPADLPCSSKSLFENHTRIEENKMENRSKLDTDTKTSAEMKINGNASNGLNTNNDLSQLLALPRPGPRMSCMEEESIRERMRTALLKQCSAILKQGDQKYTKESLRKMFQDKDLLERIFRLFDTERNNYLVQEDWIEFLKGRLTNEKQIELAEQLESAAYVLCGDDVITVEAFLRILQAKGVTEKIFRIVDSDGDGFTTADEVMEFLASVSTTRSRTGFDKTSVEWLEQLFRETVGEENEIRREDFHKIVISKNSFFTERVFQIFDEDNSGAISLQEFIDAMHQFAGKSPEDKIRFLFKVYDLDGDGLIQHRELQHVMRACMEENGMRFSDQQLEELTAAMFEDADVEGRGAITYEALKNQLEKHGGLLENLSISIDRWLVPPKPKAETKSSVGKFLRRKPYQLSLQYFKNNYVFLIFLGAFFVLNAGLFISRAIEYRKSNGFVIVARACGQCLNFNCMWVLVLMLRQSITFLRSRGFSVVLPLDHHIYLHMLTGLLIFGYSVVHTIMHLCNFTLLVVNDPVVNHGNFTVSEWLLTERPGMFGLVGGCANPTGIALAVIILIMFICSHPFIRRKGSFEVFYWTHLLYLPFWLLLIFHGPNFWKWFVVPGLIYIAERISRLAWMRSERGKTYISSGLLLPSKVTHLVIKRPLHFDFHPGDYVFANIPAIATYEWHPFTISSAPEQEEYMWLHIRGVGEWTNRLYEYFEKEHTRLHAGEVAAHDSTEGSTTVSEPLTKLHAQLDRSISNKSTKSNGVKKGSVDFAVSAFSNEAFTIDEDNAMNDSDVKAMSTPRKITPEKKMHLLQVPMKSPLEKSLSMPDMQNKLKKKQRLIALRDFTRSESEKSFDECQMRRAHMKSLGLAYLSPQNKSLAQSFRYMRTKPTIIAFKTPSLEHCEQKASSASIINITRRRLSKTLSPDKDVESGKKQEDAKAKDDNHGITFDKSFSNFPVGKPLEIYLDGPYGAPSSHIFRAQHAVLIATGIGVTPFASILQSIMHRYWKARHCCPKCQHTWASDIPPTVMNLRKVDFFWINREQRSFEWFVSLLSQLEIEQAELGGAMERFLEMHMYITSALQRSDMKAVGLQLALDLLHEKEKRDLITGLKTRTIAGRPNWEKVFKQIQDQKKGKVTVFYCGPPQLARILRVKCDQFGFIFRKEIF